LDKGRPATLVALEVLRNAVSFGMVTQQQACAHSGQFSDYVSSSATGLCWARWTPLALKQPQ